MTQSVTNRISAACSIPNTPLRHKRCSQADCACDCHKDGRLHEMKRRRGDWGGKHLKIKRQ